jgi:hypothetical protein
LANSLRRLKKELESLVEIDGLRKQVLELESENKKTAAELRELRKELAAISKKVASIGPGGKKVKTPALIDLIEDMAGTLNSPIKVTELRDELLKDKRLKSKAGNFYAVIATAMNNSPKFEKTGAGEYRYKG